MNLSDLPSYEAAKTRYAGLYDPPQPNTPSMSPPTPTPLQSPQDVGNAASLLSLIGAGQGKTGKTGPRGPIDTSGNNWEQTAHQLFTQRWGYSPQDWKKLDYIIEHESSWNPNAYNPNTVNGKNAMGIPQRMMDPSFRNSKWMDNPMAQIRWLHNYIQSRYHGIDNAYDFKKREGWY